MKSRLLAYYLLLTLPACAGVLLLAAAGARAQNMYVADWDEPGAIYVYAPGSQTHTTFFSGSTSFLGEPEGIAFDSSGNLYVEDSAEGKIDKITPGGSESTFAMGLGNPTGLAFDSAGDLFEAGGSGNNVEEFKDIGGTLSSTATSFATGLNGPGGIAFDSAGNLYVSSGNTGNIYEYQNMGGTLSSSAIIYASGFTKPFGLAFNAAGNLLVVYDGNDGATAGGVDEIVGNNKIPIVTGLDVPNNLAFDNAGDLFVTDSNNGDITEVAVGGNVTSFAVGNNVTGIAFEDVALPMPEPSTLGLLAIGTAALFARRLKLR